MSNQGLRGGLKVPNWLANRPGLSTAFNTLYTMALVFDVMIEGMKAGRAASFPGYGDRTDSLPLIGRSRGFVQGPSQSDQAFANQLQQWLQTWVTCGLDLTLLRVLQAYIPGTPTLRIVNRGNFWTSLFPDGSYSRVTGTVVPGGVYTPFTYAASAVMNWDGNSNTEFAGNWSDTWLIIENGPYAQETRSLSDVASAYGSLAAWAAARGGTGVNIPQSERQQIAQIINQWLPPHANIKCVIFAFNSTDFNPLGTPAPDGYCETYSYPSGTAKVAHRPTTAVYWHLPFSLPMGMNDA